MSLGLLVKQVRWKLGFNQKELGLRMFVSQQEISKWETGHITLPHERIFELKDWYEYLTGDKKGAKRLFDPYVNEIRNKVKNKV